MGKPEEDPKKNAHVIIPEDPSNELLQILDLIGTITVIKDVVKNTHTQIGDIKTQANTDITTQQRAAFTERVTQIGTDAAVVFDALEHDLMSQELHTDKEVPKESI